jgi:glycine/D-amino acid oxidase-like deaminating enzyme/nitrite reductase/ring-hydroxylating ferredoxin subunit
MTGLHGMAFEFRNVPLNQYQIFFMETNSIWKATGGACDQYDSLFGDHSAEVVVIGGGITGLTAAMLLSQAGKKVILLEALRIGEGTTGNSTGNLYVTVDEHLSTLSKKWSQDVAKQVVASRRAAINLIRDTVSRFQLDCAFTEVPFNLFTEREDRDAEEALDKEQKAFSDAGLGPLMSSNAQLPFTTRRVLTVPGQAQFHPLKYARQLAASLNLHCRIHENSQVVDIDEEKGIVSTAGGTVKADHIVMATHTPKGVWMVQTVLGAYREHGVAAELAAGSLAPGIYWSLHMPKHSIRPFSDSGRNYVMVIGDKYKTGHAEDTGSYVRGLSSYLNDRFKLGTATYTWGGQHYRAADGLPYIGKSKGRLYHLTGFATDGLVYGTLGAMIVADQILGKENPWLDTYNIKRFTPVKSFTEFFRIGADTIANYMKDTPWNVDVKSETDITPGQGKLLEKDGEKLAVYRDENGALHSVSAICTHMKCTVHWNEVEKSWDCPCHGSRFRPDGQVIEGPAVVSLPVKPIESKK